DSLPQRAVVGEPGGHADNIGTAGRRARVLPPLWRRLSAPSARLLRKWGAGISPYLVPVGPLVPGPGPGAVQKPAQLPQDIAQRHPRAEQGNPLPGQTRVDGQWETRVGPPLVAQIAERPPFDGQRDFDG